MFQCYNRLIVFFAMKSAVHGTNTLLVNGSFSKLCNCSIILIQISILALDTYVYSSSAGPKYTTDCF